MRAVVCRELGPPELLRIEEMATPSLTSHQVMVKTHAYGLNYVDLLMARGEYQHKPELPFVAGLEAAGVIIEVGRDVTELEVGERVMISARPGAFAELVAVDSHLVIPIPETLPFDQAACFRSAFSTAYHGLVQGGRVVAGDWVLVHSAAGGMGMAGVQVAKRLGANVIATASTEDKLTFARELGADAAVNYQSGAFRDAVKAITEGRGVDVVFDPVGGAVFDESMRCLNWGARLVVVGFTSGTPAVAKTNHLLIKGASVIGIRAGEFSRRNPDVARENMRTLLAWAAKGEIAPAISHRFELTEIAAALNVLATRSVMGRIVLQP